eukprot:6194457-Pleurochrysis_carterae.AAC.1
MDSKAHHMEKRQQASTESAHLCHHHYDADEIAPFICPPIPSLTQVPVAARRQRRRWRRRAASRILYARIARPGFSAAHSCFPVATAWRWLRCTSTRWRASGLRSKYEPWYRSESSHTFRGRTHGRRYGQFAKGRDGARPVGRETRAERRGRDRLDETKRLQLRCRAVRHTMYCGPPVEAEKGALTVDTLLAGLRPYI